MLYIKVNLSEECKKTGKRGVPGQYVIYTKKHFWQKWTAVQGYASYDWAIDDAKKLRKENERVPRYF